MARYICPFIAYSSGRSPSRTIGVWSARLPQPCQIEVRCTFVENQAYGYPNRQYILLHGVYSFLGPTQYLTPESNLLAMNNSQTIP